MGVLQALKRMAAMASGDFEEIFQGFRCPACPEVAARLLDATKDPEAGAERLASLIEADPGLASRVLRLVNSAAYALPGTVSTIRHAVTLLGTKEIQGLALALSVKEAIKDPGRGGFDLNLFWYDSLTRAVFARLVAERGGTEPEEAFTAALLQDIALPVLLREWFELYREVYEDWEKGRAPLHKLEEERLGWTHAEAGAWIARRWRLPEVLACSIALHVRPAAELAEAGLETTPVIPVAVSSLIPRLFQEGPEALIQAGSALGFSGKEILGLAEEAVALTGELAASFGLNPVERTWTGREVPPGP